VSYILRRKCKVCHWIEQEENFGFFRQTDEVFFAWEKTKEIAQILKAKMIIFQTPPSFLPTEENKRNIKEFFGNIEGEKFFYCWEPRGKWSQEEIKEICRDLNLIDCIDPFRRKSTHHEKISYFRLHGKKSYRDKYTEEDFREIIKIINFWRQKKTSYYIMFNNVFMFEDGLKFKQMLFSK
jgi:uncharacterized protein YecE (DUF72 family)